jgi:uncharacterized membrane protein YbjE (DUF340 family)
MWFFILLMMNTRDTLRNRKRINLIFSRQLMNWMTSFFRLLNLITIKTLQREIRKQTMFWKQIHHSKTIIFSSSNCKKRSMIIKSWLHWRNTKMRRNLISFINLLIHWEIKWTAFRVQKINQLRNKKWKKTLTISEKEVCRKSFTFILGSTSLKTVSSMILRISWIKLTWENIWSFAKILRSHFQNQR